MTSVGTLVSLDMKDLITLMASEISRKVVDELREGEIDPLKKELADLKNKFAAPSPNTIAMARLSGGFEALWKLGVVTLAALEAWHFLKGFVG